MDSTMLFGGLEGGATHSNLLIVDETGRILGKASGPSTNHWVLGIPECTDRVIKMLHEAKDDANIPRDQPLDSLALTMSGCEQESTNAELAARVREKDANCARIIHVASDTVGSLFTGTHDEGIVLIAGTGSNALLRTTDGEQFGCGGWGHLLGDEGSAYWIAHRAVKTIFDDVDGLRPAQYPTDRVWEAIREHYNVDTRADLLEHAYAHFDKTHFAGLTAKLSQIAITGDRLTRQLFADAGQVLADNVVALSRHTNSRKLRVVCVGSVWKSWSFLQPGLVRQLKKRNVKSELEFVLLKVSSAVGATYLAAKQINYDLPRDDNECCQVFFTYYPETTNGIEIYTPEGVKETDIFTDGLNGKGVNGLNGKLNGKYENGTENGEWTNRS